MTIKAEDLNGQYLDAVGLGASQAVAYTGTAAASNAFNAQTSVVRVVATTDCFISTGANPTATTSSAYLPAGTVEYIRVNPQDKISAVRRSADGTLYVTETN
jgi:hypothetical protein